MARPSSSALADYAFVLACVVLVGVVAVRWLMPRDATAGIKPEAAEERFRVKTRLPSIPGVQLNPSGPTVLAFVASSCGFCTQSMDFYRRLGDKARNSQGRTRLIFLSSTDEYEELRQYVATYNVQADGMVSYKVGTVQVVGTPTIVLVGQDGQVIESYRGLLSAAQEAKMLGHLD